MVLDHGLQDRLDLDLNRIVEDLEVEILIRGVQNRVVLNFNRRLVLIHGIQNRVVLDFNRRLVLGGLLDRAVLVLGSLQDRMVLSRGLLVHNLRVRAD
jgi:hypothetical protein